LRLTFYVLAGGFDRKMRSDRLGNQG
jgi:hypothetical protein